MASERELIRSDIEEYLRRYQGKELLRFVAVGSVDDGKSTLIGRLLYDTGSVFEDQLAAVKKASHMAGTDIDLSLLTDGLAAEREQGITIDVAYRYFSTDKRKFIIADTPGHTQYTRNMVTGASTASVAIILIDARLGVLQQSRRHAYIASLLGIPHLAVCVNKMDLVAYDRAAFTSIQAEFAAFSRSPSFGFTSVTFFPISALEGANCVHRSAKTPWYEGRTVLEFLESVPLVADRVRPGSFRYPVQYVLRPNLDYRGFAGRLVSGVVRKGDTVMVLPSGRTSRIKAIDVFEGELLAASAPQSVTLRLEDEIDVSRGDMLVPPADVPQMKRTFDAHLVWMNDAALDPSKTYLLKHTTQTVRVDVNRVHWRKDMDSLEERPTATLALNDIGRVTLTAHRVLYLDPYESNRDTGSFILIDSITNGTVGAGMVIDEARDGARPQDLAAALRDAGEGERGRARSHVSADERRRRFGVAPGVVVFAGFGARTRAPAYAVERRLFDAGACAAVLRTQPLARCLAAAGAVADAGMLALVAVDSAQLDEHAVSAHLEGRSVLVVRPDPGAAALDEGADAVLAVMRQRGLLA